MIAPTIDRSADEAAIRDIISNLQTAWNSGDGDAFAVPFAADSDYTVWNGHYFKGREANAAGHNHIFNTIYKGTTQKMTVRWLRFLSDDVAAVQCDGGTVNGERDWPQVRPLAVLSKRDGRWEIDIFQNTPIMPQPGSGAPS